MRTVLALILSALTLAALVATAGQAASSRSDACVRAKGERAIAICTRAIDSRRLAGRDLARAHVRRGLEYARAQKLEQALADYDLAIKADPTYATAFVNRGVAWVKSSDHERAIADLGQAIRMAPSYARAYAFRGFVLAATGQIESALDDLNEAVRLGPNDALTHANRGAVLVQKGDYDRAIADLDQAIRIDANLAAAYSYRGDAYSKKGDVGRAMADLNAALKLDETPGGAVRRGLLEETTDELGSARVATTSGKPTQKPSSKTRPQQPQDVAAKPEQANPEQTKPQQAKPERPKPANLQQPAAQQTQPQPSNTTPPASASAPTATSPAASGSPTTPAAGSAATTIAPPQVQPAAPSSSAILGDQAAVPPGAAPAATGRPDHSAPLASKRPRRALLIGNAAYPDHDTVLAHPLADVRALAGELTKLGFEVETKLNVTKGELERALRSFYETITPETTALVYFGGFAIQINRSNYFIPVDATIYTEPDVVRTGVNLSAVLSELDLRQAQLKIAIVDASRRNPFERRLLRKGSIGLAPMTGRAGTMVMFAAAPDQAIDESDGENSLFIRTLLDEFRKPSTTVEQAFGRTRTAIARATNGVQVPWISNLAEDFSLRSKQVEESR